MRIKSLFAQERETAIVDYRKKYFITSEGLATEPKYFERLNEICKYKKNSIDFSKFEPGIKKAIQREKKLVEDVTKIKYELGTNVGILVNNILNDKD